MGTTVWVWFCGTFGYIWLLPCHHDDEKCWKHESSNKWPTSNNGQEDAETLTPYQTMLCALHKSKISVTGVLLQGDWTALMLTDHRDTAQLLMEHKADVQAQRKVKCWRRCIAWFTGNCVHGFSYVYIYHSTYPAKFPWVLATHTWQPFELFV